MRRVRTRFAPSPTGFLHLGGIRTALYNYLLAKKYNGDFILRIEDTDRTRFVECAQDYIIEALKWLGIEPNEGIYNGGPHEPYLQSLRKDIYKEYALKLVDSGWAYYCFDTQEELDEMHRKMSESNIANPQYNYISRNYMKNSLTLSKEEVNSRISNGEPYVIRFKIPENEIVRFHDIVRGWIKVDSKTLDDKVLLKSDGMATYHLAATVDDHLMEISHIIRGEEWLPSAPLHYLMNKAFGWLDTIPEFVHLPLLLKPNGQGKLSKRDAEEGGFPIFPLSYIDPRTNNKITGFKDKGYLPEAIINALVLLGWNPGNNKEIMSMDELIETFSLEKLQKSGARFNIKKFEWFNHQYIKNSSNDYLISLLSKKVTKDTFSSAEAAFNTKLNNSFLNPEAAHTSKVTNQTKFGSSFLDAEAAHTSKVCNSELFEKSSTKTFTFSNEESNFNTKDINRNKLNKILDLVKERANFVDDIYTNSKYFFIPPKDFDKGNLADEQIDFSIKWIEKFMSLIKDKPLEFDILHEFLKETLEKDNLKMVDVMPTFRLILFGTINGPDIIKSIIILGLYETNKRIECFKNVFVKNI